MDNNVVAASSFRPKTTVTPCVSSAATEHEQSTGNQLNPMEIPAVVEKICAYLPLEFLIQCRLVNSLFYQCSTLSGGFNPEIRLTSIKQLKKFMELMNKSKLGQSFSSRVYIDLSAVTETKWLLDFASKFGPTIKSLELNEECFSFFPERDTKRSKKLILGVLSRTTQLEQLRVGTKHEILLRKSDQSKIRECFPTVRLLSVQANVLEERPLARGKMSLGAFLVSRTPSLKQLELPLTNFDYKQHPKGLVNAMITKEFFDQKRTDLEHLLPMTSMSPHSLDNLRDLVDLRFKLKSVVMEIWGDNRQVMNFFCRWMTQQSNHLEKLELEVWLPLDANRRLTLPEMKKLSAMEMSFHFRRYPHPDLDLATRPVQILGLPNLCSLILHEHDGFGSFASLCLPTVKHLELHEVNRGQSFSAPWSQVLPNLSSLKCELNAEDDESDEKLSYILTHFRNLDDFELDIKDESGCVDFWDIFTGDVPPWFFEDAVSEKTLGRNSQKEDDEEEEEAEEEEEDDRIPSLQYFKGLRKLVVRPGSCINLKAVVFMVLEGRLKFLQYLEIRGTSNELKDFEIYRELIQRIHRSVVVNKCVTDGRRTTEESEDDEDES